MVHKFPRLPLTYKNREKKYFAVIFTVVTTYFSPDHWVDNFKLKSHCLLIENFLFSSLTYYCKKNWFIHIHFDLTLAKIFDLKWFHQAIYQSTNAAGGGDFGSLEECRRKLRQK